VSPLLPFLISDQYTGAHLEPRYDISARVGAEDSRRLLAASPGTSWKLRPTEGERVASSNDERLRHAHAGSRGSVIEGANVLAHGRSLSRRSWQMFMTQWGGAQPSWRSGVAQP